jgi:hypothetical protein
MKMKNRYCIIGLVMLLLAGGCGKPNEPESIVPPDISGGYKIVATYVTPGLAQDVVVRDRLAYVAEGEGGLLILDVATPSDPKFVSVTTEGVRGYSSKVALKDSIVYLAAGTFGINAINAANPDTPFVTIANVAMKPARNLLVHEHYLFAATSETGVSIANIIYPSQPDVRGGVNTIGYAMGLAISSDSSFLYVASGEMGFSIYNISNFMDGYGIYPLSGWCDTPGYAESILILEDRSLAFLACGTAGLQIMDYSDTTNIQIVGSYSTGGYAKELAFQDDRIMITCEKQGLQVIEVADVTNPTFIGQVPTQFALGLDVNENYIYVADDLEGLIVVSIPQ